MASPMASQQFPQIEVSRYRPNNDGKPVVRSYQFTVDAGPPGKLAKGSRHAAVTRRAESLGYPHTADRDARGDTLLPGCAPDLTRGRG